jgi:hypothetical protein
LTHNAQEYLIRALTYAAAYGLDEYYECATISGREIADFLVRAVSESKMKEQTYVLSGVHTSTWWRMLRGAYAKLGDLDEMKLKVLLESNGHWYLGNKPANTKQIFSTQNIGRLYHSVYADGYRLIHSQKELRSIVDRFNGGK